MQEQPARQSRQLVLCEGATREENVQGNQETGVDKVYAAGFMTRVHEPYCRFNTVGPVCMLQA